MARHEAPADQALEQGLAAMGLALEEQARRGLVLFLEELLRFDESYSLVSTASRAHVLQRHALDALSILPYLQGRVVLDLGCGPGLPGLPLAIADATRQYVLLDRSEKKTRLVRHMLRRLDLPHVRCVVQEAEQFGGHHDTVVTRAFGNLACVVAACDHLLAPGGCLVLMKGQVRLEQPPPGYVLERLEALQVPGVTASRHVAIWRKEGLPWRG